MVLKLMILLDQRNLEKTSSRQQKKISFYTMLKRDFYFIILPNF